MTTATEERINRVNERLLREHLAASNKALADGDHAAAATRYDEMVIAAIRIGDREAAARWLHAAMDAARMVARKNRMTTNRNDATEHAEPAAVLVNTGHNGFQFTGQTIHTVKPGTYSEKRVANHPYRSAVTACCGRRVLNIERVLDTLPTAATSGVTICGRVKR